MSRFYFGDSDESDTDFNDDNLPFPKPLARTSFLTPDFDPATFLSSLSNRHQSLGDLQTELRELSESLNKELLDLVNENYQDFLSLGTALKGGEDKVEEVRAGLLGFQRNVGTLKEQVETRTQEIRTLFDEKKKLRSSVTVGYELLDIADKIELLEANLMIGNHAKEGDDTDDAGALDSDEDLSGVLLEDESDAEGDENLGTSYNKDDNSSGVSLRRLESHVQQYLSLNIVISRVGQQHPFIAGQQKRISAIKRALLLDLNGALREADSSGTKRGDRVLSVLSLYDLMEDKTETILALKKMRV